MVPLNARGLKILSRKSFEAHATSKFDNPLSSSFDENDAVLYFDEVKVPWERVFVHNDVQMAQAQWHAIPTHVYQNYQCQIRLMVKLRFLLGLARKIADTNGIAGFPQVRETLGQLAAEAAMVEGMVVGMEASGWHYGQYFVPNKKLLYSAMVLTQQLYPKFVTTLRELSGGGMIMLPSSVDDFANPGAGGLYRQDAALARHRLGRAREAVQARVGRRRLGVRLAPPAVRDVLRRRQHGDARPCVPDLRLGTGRGLVDRFMSTYGISQALNVSTSQALHTQMSDSET